jgi:hypothetical protein
VIVSSTTVHARAQNPKSFGAVNISYHCALTVHLLNPRCTCLRVPFGVCGARILHSLPIRDGSNL